MCQFFIATARTHYILGQVWSSHSIVSSSRTVRSCSPWGGRWIGHWMTTWTMVCSSAPHSQTAEETIPHLGKIYENLRKLWAKSVKLFAKSLKIWANSLKIRAVHRFLFEKISPNVCRITWRLFFGRSSQIKVFMICVGENIRRKSCFWSSLEKFGQKSSNIYLFLHLAMLLTL